MPTEDTSLKYSALIRVMKNGYMVKFLSDEYREMMVAYTLEDVKKILERGLKPIESRETKSKNRAEKEKKRKPKP